MVNLENRITEALRQRFPDATVRVERRGGAVRFHGKIVWEGFAPLEQIERQRLTHDTVRAALGHDAENVSIILTYSPEEHRILSETDDE